MQMLFSGKMEKCPTPGLLQSPEYPQLSLISYVKPIEKYLVFMLQNGTKSQLYSQAILTTL
jgi:hypothetical protein